ncbi:hypothetical protein N9537_06400 [Porticoccaceae bacterium]|nr:hypothetical protein [Porticoccaceae bacterium]
MEALIGLAGVVVGSLITGLFLLWSNRQNYEHDEEKNKRRMLLEKYELIYSGLLVYQKLASDISMQMISEAGYSGKFDSSVISKAYASSNLQMNVTFYAPELRELIAEMDKKQNLVVRSATEFLLAKGQSKEEKERYTETAIIASAELQKITNQAIQKLASLASGQVHA